MEQLNLDGMTSSELATLDTLLDNAITQRLTGVGSGTGGKDLAVEGYTIKGRSVTLTTLRDLIELRGNVKNAIAKKAVEPDGLGIGLASINDPDGPPAGGPYRWPFTS